MSQTTIHTMHVPTGWSVEQTWEAISRGEKTPVTDGYWTNAEIEGLTTEVESEDEEGWTLKVTGGKLVAWHPLEGQAPTS